MTPDALRNLELVCCAQREADRAALLAGRRLEDVNQTAALEADVLGRLRTELLSEQKG